MGEVRIVADVEVEDSRTLVALIGPGQEHLKAVTRALGVESGVRGNTIRLSGVAEKVELAERLGALAPGLLGKLGPLFRRPAGAPVVSPDTPVEADVADLLAARFIRPERQPAAWRLLEAYIDAQAWGRHRLDLDVNRFNDLEFDLARAGLHPQFGLTRLVNDELRLPLQTYRGLSTGCIQHDQALQAASAWRNVLNHLSAENRAIAEPYAAWLAQFHHYGQMAPQKARPAPDLVVIYRA